ncbi:MAG TPA: HypC/HybG/HupF family hydrogenase formation chaperone [Candidatus Eisenbergiella intestinipullorum]|nr:HypC/HybG/HupF family hydrogenase formation chaperone [Candidatus Eisenbergiella intestinipullorum]
MCVALPGKVLSLDGKKAVVDFQGNQVTAEAGLVRVKPGDRVLVHAGCILQVLSEEEGDRMQELFEELEEVMKDEDPGISAEL